MSYTTPTGTVLYLVEKTIKEYRKLCQKSVRALIPELTIDQCLVLIALQNQPGLSQNQIASLLLKDSASITRIIESLVKVNYLKRTVNAQDRRRHQLFLSPSGNKALNKLEPVIIENRETALKGLSSEDIDKLEELLSKMIHNCTQE